MGKAKLSLKTEKEQFGKPYSLSVNIKIAPCQYLVVIDAFCVGMDDHTA